MKEKEKQCECNQQYHDLHVINIIISFDVNENIIIQTNFIFKALFLFSPISSNVKQKYILCVTSKLIMKVRDACVFELN